MNRLLFVLALFTGIVWAAPAGDYPAPKFDPQRYLAHIKVLASPDMKGRGSGSPELNKAAEYIARQFKAAGLKPIDGKSYLQTFNVTSSAHLGKHNSLSYVAGDKKTVAKTAQFSPLNFSSSGEFTGKVVFAGFGITAKEYGYDDYAGIDAK